MTSVKPLPLASVQFRSRIIDALDRFGYIDEDTCTGTCPLCGDILSVYFHGRAARADLVCRLGCDEQAIGRALTQRPARREVA